MLIKECFRRFEAGRRTVSKREAKKVFRQPQTELWNEGKELNIVW